MGTFTLYRRCPKFSIVPSHAFLLVAAVFSLPCVQECKCNKPFDELTGILLLQGKSVLLGAPRAIAKVLAWNHTRAAEPVRYGTKLAFTYVRTAELLPYPASWPQNNDDRRVLQNQARPVNINEAEIRMPHHVRHDPSERIGPVSRTEALLRYAIGYDLYSPFGRICVCA